MNLKIRFKNKTFIASILLAIATPILAYYGLTSQDFTTWPKVAEVIIDAIKNPYVCLCVAVSLYNATLDPTTKGIADSEEVKGRQ